MTTFNYSKLATLVPKQLQEENSAKEVQQNSGCPPNAPSEVGTRQLEQLPTSSYPQNSMGTHNNEKSGTQEVNNSGTHNLKSKVTHKKKTVGNYKPDRHSGNKIQLGIRQSIAIVETAKQFCAEHNLLLQDLYELAVTHYISNMGTHNNEKSATHILVTKLSTNVGSKLPHDDLMMFKTHDDIIMLYREMTGRRWTAADDRAASPFNNIDRRLIEIGMIHTVFNARGKRINSFAYFIPEIQLMIDLHVNNENLDVYLRARRERLAKWMQNQRKNAGSSKS